MIGRSMMFFLKDRHFLLSQNNGVIYNVRYLRIITVLNCNDLLDQP